MTPSFDSTTTARGVQMTVDAALFNKPPNVATNAFWSADSLQSSIELDKWNKAYPYRLMVVQAVGGSYALVDGWNFTLPIPPQEIGVSMPFAINTSATLAGIVEEHGGAPFKMISLSGTTGVLPTRQNVNDNVLSSFATFASPVGTILDVANGLTGNAINRIVSAGAQAASAITGGRPNLQEVPKGGDFANAQVVNTTHTGLYQFKLLEAYLERYAEIKRTAKGQDYRLCFCIDKEGAYYLVTPVTFDVQRSASSPFEYPFRLAFKAWKRIKKPAGYGATSTQASILNGLANPSSLGLFAENLASARAALISAGDAVYSLYQAPAGQLFESLRQVTLAAKVAAGIAPMFSDFSTKIQQDFFNSVDARWWQETWEKLTATNVNSALPESASPEAGAKAFAKSLSRPTKETHKLLSGILPERLPLSPALLKAINEEKRQVKVFTRDDYQKQRDLYAATVIDFTRIVQPSYNPTYVEHPTPPSTSTRTPTDQEFEVLYALNNAIINIDKIVTVLDKPQAGKERSIDYIAGLATRSGIAFKKPTSKFPVPFPYGYTLERLALEYLNDANRWHEIAALNGLRAPYVDEEGQELALVTNGNGNVVTVVDTALLSVGKKVSVYSDAKAPTSRRIVGINRVEGEYVVVTLDGDATLSDYTVADNAVLHFFAPDTVNSQMTLYIPSDSEAPDVEGLLFTKTLPGVDEFDPLLEVGGIDLLLDSKGDIVVTPDGDARYAVGLTNIIQKLKLLLKTARGTLLQHPEYGLNIQAGVSVADTPAKEILNTVQSAVSDDPTFSGVENVSVAVRGPAIVISMTLRVRYTNNLVPVSFSL